MDVSLVLFKKGGGRRSFVLPNQMVLVGRSADCHFRIPVMSVSRRHCEFFIEDGKLRIHDLGSRNGTYLNGIRMENAELRAGDFVRIGPVLFGVQIDGSPGQLTPPDFVLLDENHPDEQPGDGSTILQTPQPGQTQTPQRDVADDIMSWLDEKEGKGKTPEAGRGPTQR